MGNCEDCRHWNDKAWDEGELISIIDVAGRAYCLSFEFDTYPTTNHDSQVVACGFPGSEGQPVVRTRGDFGCVLFEGREIR